MSDRASSLLINRVFGTLGACASVLLAGCLERSIKVTSNPSGAVVWINDVEVGRTPVECDFTYFGDFSVRLRKEGYEPVVDVRSAKPPIQEQPVIDLAAEALPVTFKHHVVWHYDLEPVIESRLSRSEAEAAVIHQARQLREQLQGAQVNAAPAGTVKGAEPGAGSEQPSK